VTLRAPAYRVAWPCVVILAVGLFVAAPAHGYLVGPAIPLEALAGTADLVCKATVLGERAAIDHGLSL
jgi:hypothetical protein